MSIFRTFILTFFVLALGVAQANAQETDIIVRVKTKDGTFIDTSMGGALISITDKRNGEIIVQGFSHGKSGNAEEMLTKTTERNGVMSDKDSAKFEFSIDLFEPTPVTITATGPLAQKQSLFTTSSDYILVPNKDYTSGDGIVLEVPGIVVDVLNPPAGREFEFDPEAPVSISANVTKLCGGCLINLDGLWPEKRYEVEAQVFQGTRPVATVPMVYGGQDSQFFTNLKIPQAGAYIVTVTAYDTVTKEAGMDSTSLVLVEKE